MRSTQHHYSCLFFLLAYLATEGFAGGAAHPARGSSISPKNFEILGIELPDSTVSDVERILGPAPSKQADNVEEASACYTSPGSDRTVLEFRYWFESVVGFRLFTGTLQYRNHCAKSKLISADLTTSSGIKVGLSKDEVIKLLGPPSKRQQNSFTYEVSYDRPPTHEEIKRSKDAYRPVPASISVYGKIDLGFQHGKVVWVDIARRYDMEFDSR
jgi:hypothetical protein